VLVTSTNFMKLPILAEIGLLSMLSMAMVQPVNAQSATDLNQGSANEESSDFFSNRDNGGINSMLDLIHNANFGSIRTQEQFRQDQQQSINSAAQEFRDRQQQLLRQSQSTNPPTTPAPVPQN